MEFLRVAKRRSVFSETIYVLLNIAMATAVLAAVWATGSPLLGVIIVLVSKWRVIAVRPRYWFTHIEVNMVDIIVSVGMVFLIYLAGQAGTMQGLVVQTLLAALYAAWLLFIKPRANRKAVAVQAGAATVIGTMAIVSLSYEWPSTLVVLTTWVIGYASARHVLASYSEESLRLLSLVWGFVAAEVAWLTYHWSIGYPLPFAAGLKLPQFTLILLGLGFIAERAYNSFYHHDKIRRNDVLLPMLLVFGVLAVVLVFFNDILPLSLYQ
jgi:hypothetical protein